MSSKHIRPSITLPMNTFAATPHTNTVEGYFAILKRGIFGIYHSVSEEHLKRYLCEFDFRYNYRTSLGYTDMQRTEIAAAGIYGKRLTYRRPSDRPNV